MSVERETRADVARRIRELRDRFGEFPVREATVENDPAFFEQGWEMAAEGWRGDAGAWVSDADGRVLLIRHEGAPDEWGVPGGSHEPGESFVETARREVREETGVRCDVTGVAFARRKQVVHAEDPDRRWFMLTVVFEADASSNDGADGDDRLSVGDDEVLAARWFAERPDSVAGFVREQADEWDWPDGA